MKKYAVTSKTGVDHVTVDENGVIFSCLLRTEFIGQKFIRLVEWLSQEDGEPCQVQKL